MPYVHKTVAKNYSAGESTDTWNQRVDQSLFQLALDLDEAGWLIDYRFPYAVVRTIADFSVSFGPGLESFFGVFPPNFNPGVSANALLVIDQLPPAYVPPLGFEVFEVVGGTPGAERRANLHGAVVAALKALGPPTGGYETLYTDPDDFAFNNTFLAWAQFSTAFHGDPKVLKQAGAHPSPSGVAINSTVTPYASGGYAAVSQENGSPFNNTALFFGRDAVAGIEPFKVTMFGAKSVGDQPLAFTMEPGVSRTVFTRLEINRSAYVFAASPHGCFLAQSSDGQNGGVTCAALDLPVGTSGITDAVFSSIQEHGGAVDPQFRHGPSVQGVLYMEVNAQVLVAQNPGMRGPYVMSLWGPSNGWENGMPQISEPWCGFSVDPDEPIAPILGKLPGALVVNGAFDAGAQPPFQFDNAAWRMFTHGAVENGAGQLASIAFRTPEEAADPECS